MTEYLDHDDFYAGPRVLRVRAMRVEMVAGSEELVLYFYNEPRGLILTERLVEDLSAVLGRSRMVDEFFANKPGGHA